MNTYRAVTIAAWIIMSFPVLVHAQSSAPNNQDTTRLQIAREILEANGGARAAEVRMRSAVAALTDLTASALPKMDSRAVELQASLMKYVVDEEVEAIPQIIEQTAKAYADNLSEQELRDLLVWSASPSGQAFSRKMPVITRELMAQQGPLLKKITAGAVSKAIIRVCEDVKCTDNDRKTIIAIAQKAVPLS